METVLEQMRAPSHPSWIIFKRVLFASACLNGLICPGIIALVDLTNFTATSKRPLFFIYSNS